MNSTDLFVFVLFFVVLFFLFLFLFVCCLFSFFFGGGVPELLPDLVTPGAGKLNFSSHVFL